MFIDVIRQYHGDGIYLEAFLCSVVLIFRICRKQESDTGKKLLWALGLAVLLIYNGLSYRLADKWTDVTTYYRFFWILPVTFVIAYALTMAFASKDWKKKLLGLLFFSVCIMVGGNLFLTKANLHKPQNLYGLDDQAIAVADLVMEDWAGEEKNPVVAVDMYLEYQIRTYEPRIIWGISRPAYLDQAKNGYDYKNGNYKHQQRVIAAVNEGLKEDVQALDKSLKHLEIDYLVIRMEFDMDGYLAQIGFMPVGTCGMYCVYGR